MTSTSLVHLKCLCGEVTAPGSLLASSELPASTEICHCNSCRRRTGSLTPTYPALRSPPPEGVLAKLQAYSSSNILTDYFCAQCGCHCFAQNHVKQEWFCLGGIIEQTPGSKSNGIQRPPDCVRVTSHEYILDTVDGGLTPFLLKLDQRLVPTWSAALREGPSDLSFDDVLKMAHESSAQLTQPAESEYLEAQCHCGGVSLLIKRANYNPDLNARYIPSDRSKYPAYLCACRSCRLSSGVSLMPYALIPSDNVFSAQNGQILDVKNASTDQKLQPLIVGHAASAPDANPGLQMKHYWSSKDVCRSFCGNCGASISYWCGQRPNELDIAVGILRAEEGSLAKRWLRWDWGRCSFKEECIDWELCEAWTKAEEVVRKIVSS